MLQRFVQGLCDGLAAEDEAPPIIDASPIIEPASSLDLPTWFKGTLPRGWTVPSHIARILALLGDVERGEVDRFAIHMPPRHGKSETVTVRFCLRCIELHPDRNYLITGYNERFARRLSRRVRTLASERGLVASDKSATDEWITHGGGTIMARGVGSPPTGVGFHGILMDDPVRRREDAESEVFRENAWEWFSDDLYSRLEPDGFLGICATLWHEDDVCVRAVGSEPGAYKVLRLPAISDDGKALWPERWPIDRLLRTKTVLTQQSGARSWESLYQQNPTPAEGDVFKTGNLQFADKAPTLVRKVRWWDLAHTQNGGDYTVGVLMGVDQSGHYWILDVMRDRLDTFARDDAIRLTAQLDGPEVLVGFPQDPSAGKSQAAYLKKQLAGFTYKAVPVDRHNKVLRAGPFSSAVNGGLVSIVRGPWTPAFVEELRTFPGKHDDQVDAGADAFNELSQPKIVFV